MFKMFFCESVLKSLMHSLSVCQLVINVNELEGFFVKLKMAFSTFFVEEKQFENIWILCSWLTALVYHTAFSSCRCKESNLNEMKYQCHSSFPSLLKEKRIYRSFVFFFVKADLLRNHVNA